MNVHPFPAAPVPLREAIVRSLFALCLVVLMGAAWARTGAVGEVAMVMGDVARLQDGRESPLRVGDVIRQGDAIVSAANGYAYIRSVDAGFISLRPNSRLRFEVYEYDPTDPSASRIRLVLERGVLRSISGQGARVARERYRLNTPLAAIGLRGTDFAVYADPDVTRVTVRQGGVVMTPLGEGCAAAGFGPCEGALARDLLAERTGVVLQLRRGDPSPSLLDTGRVPMTPDRIAPPLPNENGAAGTASPQSGSRAAEPPKLALDSGQGAVSRVVEHEARVGETLETVLGAANASEPVTPPVPNPPVAVAPPQVTAPPVVVAPPPVQVPSGPAVEWGRWRTLANAGAGVALAELTAGGRTLESVNSVYALISNRSASTPLPTAGYFSFQLSAHDGVLLDKTTHKDLPSRVTESSLSIDFDRGLFSTRLGLAAGEATGLIEAKGTVYRTGEMAYDMVRSKGVVNGFVGGPGGTEAGYLYHTQIDSNRQFVGATLWRR